MPKYKPALTVILLCLMAYISVKAQSGQNGFQYSIEGQIGITPPGKLPFWLRADQYGSIPLTGLSGGIIGSAFKSYDSTLRRSGFKWGGGVQVRTNVGNNNNITLLQAYLKASKGIFEVKVGRFNQIIGIVDSSLSSGAFSISNNALGIPQISIAIPDYYQLPFFNKLFSIKASYAAGIIGDTNIGLTSYVTHETAYYQQNSIYLKLGRPNWRLSFYGGINHHVMFTDERKVYGSYFTLSLPQVFIYSAIGKTYYPPDPTDLEQRPLVSKVGNHIGSVDMSVQYEFDNVRLLAYRQNIYDIGAIGHLANIMDGINGLSFTNKRFNAAKNDWHKLVIEFVYTKNQAGYRGSVFTTSGDENYYNNYEYSNGWTYDGLNLGNPLLSTRAYARTNLAFDDRDFVFDNRVVAFYGSAEGSIKHIILKGRLNYSLNYGTFGTSPEGHSHSQVFYPPKFGLFGEVNQLSGYLEGSKLLRNNYEVGVAVGADIGGLYYNSAGMILKLKKTFY